MRHNNTWTIVRKEFARFFGDRQMFFTTVIMPGLLIYIVYSLMGTGIGNMVNEGRGEVVTLSVENIPQSLAPAIYQMDSATAVVQQTIFQADIDALHDALQRIAPLLLEPRNRLLDETLLLPYFSYVLPQQLSGRSWEDERKINGRTTEELKKSKNAVTAPQKSQKQ